MSKFVIIKSSRIYNGGPGYNGPTLDRAVLESKVYDNREQAQADADVLTHLNPVGFEVEEHRPYCKPEVSAEQQAWLDEILEKAKAEGRHRPKPRIR